MTKAIRIFLGLTIWMVGVNGARAQGLEPLSYSITPNQNRALNIPYITGNTSTETKLDLVYDANNVRPLVVYIHGGGWHDGDKGASHYTLGEVFFNAGFAFASINYRRLVRDSKTFVPLANPVDQIPKDIASALLHLRNLPGSYKLNTNKIILVGHSAGAHLAALTVANPTFLNTVGIPRAAIAGLVLLDGHVYSIDHADFNRTTIKTMVGDINAQRNASPVFHIEANPDLKMPPTFVLYGPTNGVNHVDPPLTDQQGLLLRNALVQNGTSYVWAKKMDIAHGEFLTLLFNATHPFTENVRDFMLRALGATGTTLLNSAIFDWQAYLAFNPALITQGKGSKRLAEQHWINNGLAAGRQGSPNFSATVYLEQEMPSGLKISDLFSNDRVGAALHYLQTGKSLGLQGTPAVRAYGVPLPDAAGLSSGDAVMGNQKLKIVTSSKYSGAIEQLWYGNTQLIDDGAYAYGRLFQMAGWKFGLGKCFNPIEAGSRYYDGDGKTKSAILQNISASANGLTTLATPALFRRRQDDDCATTPAPLNRYLPPAGQVRDDKIQFEKRLSFVEGHPGVIKFDGIIRNPIESIDVTESSTNKAPFIVQLYAALKTGPGGFNNIQTVDFAACNPSRPIDSGSCKLIPRVVTDNVQGYSPTMPAITSRPDGLAFAMYSTDNNVPATSAESSAPPVYIGKYHTDVMDTAVNFSAKEKLEPGTYGFTIYVLVGPREEVRKNLIRLVQPSRAD